MMDKPLDEILKQGRRFTVIKIRLNQLLHKNSFSSKMAMRSYHSNVQRLLKCFCSCKDMTKEKVRRIYRLNIQEPLIYQQALALLKGFLQEKRDGDESITEQYVKLYEQHGKYIEAQAAVVPSDELDELFDMDLSYLMEKELHNQIQNGDNEITTPSQGELREHTNSRVEYEQYKAILRKLNQ